MNETDIWYKILVLYHVEFKHAGCTERVRDRFTWSGEWERAVTEQLTAIVAQGMGLMWEHTLYYEPFLTYIHFLNQG